MIQSQELLFLIFGTLIATTVSGLSGLGGGIILLAFFGMVLPANLIIPTHSIVQFFSNLGRAIWSYKEIDTKIVLKYSLGALVGAIAGSLLPIADLNQNIFSIIIGASILVAMWLPQNAFDYSPYIKSYFLIGAISTTVSLFIGITGPLIHPFIAKEKHLSRFGFISTEATCSGITHLTKVIVYIDWGIAFYDQKKTIVALSFVAIVGSFLGKNLLKKITENKFHTIVKLMVSILALRMIFKT
nr:hypothetical protein HAGR004_41730 [Bdellovibrio sp. HAGR004]